MRSGIFHCDEIPIRFPCVYFSNDLYRNVCDHTELVVSNVHIRILRWYDAEERKKTQQKNVNR